MLLGNGCTMGKADGKGTVAKCCGKIGAPGCNCVG